MKPIPLAEYTLLCVGISFRNCLDMEIEKDISRELFKARVHLGPKKSNHLRQPPHCDKKEIKLQKTGRVT